MLGTRDQPKGFLAETGRAEFQESNFRRKRAISVNFWAEMECCDPYFQPKLALSAEILSFGQLRFSAEMAETLSARIFGPNSGRNRNYAPFG